MTLTRVRRTLWLKTLSKISLLFNNYFIITVSDDTDFFISQIQEELLSQNIFCFRIKNSFYNVLPKLMVFSNFLKISGTNFLLLTPSNDALLLCNFLSFLKQHENTVRFQIGLYNGLVYNTNRLVYFSSKFTHYTYNGSTVISAINTNFGLTVQLMFSPIFTFLFFISICLSRRI